MGESIGVGHLQFKARVVEEEKQAVQAKRRGKMQLFFLTRCRRTEEKEGAAEWKEKKRRKRRTRDAPPFHMSQLHGMCSYDTRS